jgi:cytidylate kinase
MIIAIDGPAGAGKSTVAKKLAEDLQFFYLNSGNFYRGVTLFVLLKGFDPENEEDIITAAENARIEIRGGELYLNGNNVESRLHTDEIDNYVAEHSAIIEVRKRVNETIRKAVADLDIVAEGRDMTTVVFPDAEIKLYLDASLPARVERRNSQGVSAKSAEDIKKNLMKRDEIDKNKPFGSLRIAEDALYLDTTDLTIDAVCEKVLVEIAKLRKK